MKIYENPLRIRELDHVALRVRDLKKSEQFYCEVLGLSVAARAEEIGIIHLRAGTRFVDLILLSSKMGSSGGTDMLVSGRNMHHLCLAYEPCEVDHVFNHLNNLGIEHSAKPQENLGAEGVGISVYLQDPDEHLIELKFYQPDPNAT